MKEPKATTMFRHAQLRARERYGIRLTKELHAQIVKAIQDQKSVHVETQSHRVSVHDIDCGGTRARVVYDRQRKALVTFLPKEAMQ